MPEPSSSVASLASRWWQRWILAPWPGQLGAVPRPHLGVWLGVLVWLVAITVARYHSNALQARHVPLVFLLASYGVALTAIRLVHGPLQVSRRVVVVQLASISGFVGFWYLGRIDAFYRFFGADLPVFGVWAPVVPFAYFALCGVGFRLLWPLLVARTQGFGPAQLGVILPGSQPVEVHEHRTGRIYLLLFLLVLPLVWHSAGTPAFQHKYPLARELVGPDGGLSPVHFAVYQAFYSLVFVSGESLWRGLLTFSLARHLGSYAILLMLIPYCITHYGKPLPETLGSLVAGTLLGVLALRHGSVWSGVLLHYGVAISMDVLAIVRGPVWMRW